MLAATSSPRGDCGVLRRGDGGSGVGRGLGANVLVGGSKKGFALQSLTVEGYAGVNVAAGVVQVELKQAK